MKILYIVHQFYPEFYTGTENFVLNLSTMSSYAGHKVTIISYSFYDIDNYDGVEFNIYHKVEIYKGIKVIKIKRSKNEKEHYDIDTCSDMKKFACNLLYNERPDLIHFGHTMRMVDFVYAANMLSIPFVLTLTDYFLLCPKINLTHSQGGVCQGPEEGAACKELCSEIPAEYIKKRLAMAKKDILLKARKLYAPSHFVANVFHKELPGTSIEVIGHGISGDVGICNPSKPEGVIQLMYAGSLNRFKGLHVLLDAFIKIPQAPIHLDVYGSGTDEAYFSEIMNKIDRDERIRYCGIYTSDQLNEVYSKTDVIIIPSLCYETYSLVMHEAMRRSIPVVASKLGALCEKIQDGENGFLFESGDSDDLACILQTIANNPDKLTDIRRGLRKTMIPTIEQEAVSYERDYMVIAAEQN